MKITDLLVQAKGLRAFDTYAYIEKKVRKINAFFKTAGLDSCVLGMSGGVDSATVLALLCRAAQQPDSPIKRILPLILPIYGNGTTGQTAGRELAERQCEALGRMYSVRDLTAVYEAYLDRSPVYHTDAWTNGQLASTIRMPAFYYYAAILQGEGYKSIVVGTTNRDEGSYVGYYGKTSDGMVDLQPIADLHKSEVYKVAKHLNVLEDITRRPAMGDVWNGISTEQMMGAPYWFLEMYLGVKEFDLTDEVMRLEEIDLPIYSIYARAIESLHEKNAHKYQVNMPSHFIDCMPRRIPGGW